MHSNYYLNIIIFLKYKCDPNLGLMIKVNDQLIKCSYKNQVVEFKIKNKSKKTLTVHFGNLICPACTDICDVNFYYL